MLGKLLKYTLYAFCLFGIALLGLLLSSAYWIPAVAPRVLSHFDVKVENVYRSADRTLVFERVAYESEVVSFSLERLNLPTPIALLRDRFWRDPSDRASIDFSQVVVQLGEPVDDPERETEAITPESIFATVEGVLAMAKVWLPPISGDDIRLEFPGEGEPLILSSVRYSDAVLHLALNAWGDLPGIGAAIDWRDVKNIHLKVEADDITLAVTLHLKGLSREGVEMEGAILSGDQKIEIAALWGNEEWLPEQLAIHSDGFSYPDGLVVVTEPVNNVRIEQLDLRWKNSDYQANLKASGSWQDDHFQAVVHLRGDREHLEVDAFEANSDWLRVDLKQSARVALVDWQILSPFQFTATADLSLQNFLEMQGMVTADIQAGDDREKEGYPLTFSLQAKDLRYKEQTIPNLSIEGWLLDPLLRLERMDISLGGEKLLTLNGDFDVRTQEFQNVQGEFAIQIHDLEPWLPEDHTLDFDQLSVSFQAEGPLLTPKHQGNLELKRFPVLQDHSLDVTFEWTGTGVDEIRNRLTVVGTHDTRIEIENNASFVKNQLSLNMEEITWKIGEQILLALDQPSTLVLDFDQQEFWPWEGFSLDRTVFRGEERELLLEWTDQRINIKASGWQAADFNPFLQEDLPMVDLHEFIVEIERGDAWWAGGLGLRMSWRPEVDEASVSLNLAASLSDEGVHLSKIQAVYDQTNLIRGQVDLPLRFADSSHWVPKVDWLGEGALAGSIEGEWSDELREMILALGGPHLRDGSIELSLDGTLSDPVARLDMGLESLTVPEKWLGFSVPEVRNFSVSLSVDAENLELIQARLELRDSAVGLSGQYPYALLLAAMESNKWDWEKLLGELQLEAELKNWKSEIWRDYLPEIFRSTGELSGVVHIRPGTDLSGAIRMEGFAMRPTLFSPPVEGIQAELEFDGRKVRLINTGASIGGGTLEVTGLMDWNDLQNPKYQLSINGSNVPLVRTQDAIIRADLDLSLLQQEQEEYPLIKGEINLKSSTILIDIDPLAPQIETGPAATPPFFSIDEYPFSHWRTSIAIRGQNFLRVRSAYFTTELSASMDLQGSLGQPLLIGSIWAHGGRLRFPGANMRIESAEAFITPENPNSLQIELDAIGQNRIYVITMNVTGTVDQPRILFNATPTLTNAQILRILATGSLDGGGAGAIGLYLGQAFLGPGSGEETFADRLDVEIGQEVTESGRSTVDVIYRLDDRWSLEGEYDRFDTYNLNLIRIIRVR